MANMSCKLGMLDKSYHWNIVGSLGHCWDAMYTNSRIKNSRVSKGSEFWKDMLQAMADHWRPEVDLQISSCLLKTVTMILKHLQTRFLPKS